MNPFTSETKGAPDTLDNGLISKLRMQPTIKARILAGKPGFLGLGDFSLKSMYDAVLIAAILDGRYEEVTAALVADWGPAPHVRSENPASATSVETPHERSKPLGKAAAR
jgi:hypothetical protein